MKTKNKEYERSQVHVTLLEFMAEYNQNIPLSFPRASILHLEKFKDAHPILFKNGDRWSAAEHRKKFMDWLPSFIDIP